jgi:hypothetical protein
VFGNTGSGKSYTLAKLYYELFRQHTQDPGFVSKSRFVLIDFNGEYVDREEPGATQSTRVIADETLKASYRLSTRGKGRDQLPLSEDALHEPTFWTVLLDATEKTQAPFIRRVLGSRYWMETVKDNDALKRAIANVVWRATRTSDPNVDRQTATHLLHQVDECLGDAAPAELSALIQEFGSQLQYHGKTNAYFWSGDGWTMYNGDDGWEAFIRQKVLDLPLDFGKMDPINAIRFKLVLQYYTDVVSGHGNREHLGPLIKRLNARVDDIRKLVSVSTDDITIRPLTVISLREVNLDMRK